MLLYRILSALVGIPVILLSVWYGGLSLSAVLLIVVTIGVIEMCRLWEGLNIRVWIPGAIIGGFLYVVAAYSANGLMFELALFLSLIVSIVYLIAAYPSFSLTDLAATVFTPLYTGWLLAYLVHLRQLPNGFWWVLLVLVCTWSTDTFAYFVGVNLGRHKLAPVVSPNKSVEGSLGGVAGSVVAAIIMGLVKHQLPVWHFIVIGLLVGVIGQAGDLLESAFKRMAGIKDSGKLIPGHGGVLDRFDSLYLTAPVLYYYLKLFI